MVYIFITIISLYVGNYCTVKIYFPQNCNPERKLDIDEKRFSSTKSTIQIFENRCFFSVNAFQPFYSLWITMLHNFFFFLVLVSIEKGDPFQM